MKYEQLNLYGDDAERFKVQGKKTEELEMEARESSLENRINKFIDDKEKTKIIIKENKLGINQILHLVDEFLGDNKEDNPYSVKKMLIEKLLKKEYKLSSLVTDSEVKGNNLHLFGKKKKLYSIITKTEPELDKRALREKRNKLPPHQRGISNADLD
jgi:hypothetical protein